MLVLFDNGVPKGVASALLQHTDKEAREQGWDVLRNGELLDVAETSGFEVFVTTDKNLRYQQNLARRKLAVIALGKARWRLIRRVLPTISAAVNAATPGSYTVVDIPDS